jgi:hypothetical protein
VSTSNLFDFISPRAIPGTMARRSRHRAAAAGALAMLAALAQAPSWAAVQERTPEGIAYLEGGIGADEVELLLAQRGEYSLSIRVAAAHSGAYLPDAHLRIVDAEGTVRFNQQMHAPWLLIDLPPGRYTIEAVHGGDVRLSVVTLPPRGHREEVLYFLIPGETAPHRAEDD